MNKIAVITCCIFLLIQGGALAHEAEEHGKNYKTGAQMQKLHDMMPMYATVLAKLEAALEKGDAAAVEAEGEKLLATTPDLKKSKPHKNLKQLKMFRSIASDFEGDLKETVKLAKKGNFAKASAIFMKVEAKCGECHDKFR